jgi:hypothetical protein
LARQRFDAALIRHQADIQFGQRRRWFTAFAWFLAETRPVAKRPITAGPAGAAVLARWATAVVARAALVASGAGRTIASGRPRATPVAVTASFIALLAALVFRVFFFRGRLLRPGGQE